MLSQSPKVGKIVRNQEIVVMTNQKIATKNCQEIRKKRKFGTVTETDHMIKREKSHVIKREKSHMTKREKSHVTKREKSHVTKREKSHVTKIKKGAMIRKDQEITMIETNREIKVEIMLGKVAIRIVNVVR